MSLSLVSLLSIALCIIFLLLLGSIYLNIKFGLIILNMEDTIEECLDSLDERYASLSKILEIPIFFDSVEVRQVIDDIRKSRDSILNVANKLASVQEQKAESVE